MLGTFGLVSTCASFLVLHASHLSHPRMQASRFNVERLLPHIHAVGTAKYSELHWSHYWHIVSKKRGEDKNSHIATLGGVRILQAQLRVARVASGSSRGESGYNSPNQTGKGVRYKGIAYIGLFNLLLEDIGLD